MSETNGTRGTLRLAEARTRTPPVSGIEAMRNSLQLALFGAITEQDVAQMAEKLKAMALEGDLRAMKMFFGLVQDQAAAPRQVLKIEQAVVQLQQSVAEIQQAVIVTPAPPALPGPLPESAPRPPVDPLQEFQVMAVRYLVEHGPAWAPQIQAHLGCVELTMRRVLRRRDWFEPEADGYHVTAEARQAVLGQEDGS